MDKQDWFKIEIAKGVHTDSPRSNFLNKKYETKKTESLQKSAYVDLTHFNGKELSQYAAILDTGKIVEFSIKCSSSLETTKHLCVKTSPFKSGKFTEYEGNYLLFEKNSDSQIMFLFSSDLRYCVMLQLQQAPPLDNVIKSIVRISLFCLQEKSTNLKVKRNVYEEYAQWPIRSKKKLTSIKASLSTSHVLSILLNHEVAHEKLVKVFPITNWATDNATVEVAKHIKVSPYLTYIRNLSYNHFGDKLIIEDAKCFCVYATGVEGDDKCEPFKGSNPFITYNVSLNKELLICGSRLGNYIDFYEIKESADVESSRKKLNFTLVWAIAADELDLCRINLFNVQSFTETLLFFNQAHTIHVVNPFTKKIIYKLDLDQENLNLLCHSCQANWSCEEVYVHFYDHLKKKTTIKVFSLASKFNLSLLDQSARSVLMNYSISMLKHKSLPRVLRTQLGYF